MQGLGAPGPEGVQLLWHLVARWNDLVRSQHNPKVPASTDLLEGWFSHFKPQARLTRGLKTKAGPPLRGLDGLQHSLNRHRESAWTEDAHDSPEPNQRD